MDTQEAERVWREEVEKQIAKDEVYAPERAQLEKVVQLRRRFRVDKKCSAPEQMERLKTEI